MFSPLFVVINWISTLITLALLTTGIYFFRNYWLDVEPEHSQRFLIIALCLFGINFFGKFALQFLYGLRNLIFPNLVQTKEFSDLTRNPSGEIVHQVMSDGSNIQLELSGKREARPIILIHGLGVDKNQWGYLQQGLSRNYRVLSFDLAGYGKSTNSTDNFSLDRHARDLHHIITQNFPDQKPVLMGHSMGGMIILTFCRLYQDNLSNLVGGLVIANSTYTNPIKTTALGNFLYIFQGILIKPLLYLNLFFAPIVQILNFFNYLSGSQHVAVALSGFNGHQTWKEFDFTTQYSYLISVKSTAKSSLEMLTYDSQDILPFIKVPSLILAGKYDPTISPTASDVLAAKIPKIQKVIIKKSSHMSIIEQAKQIEIEVSNFLKSL